MSMPVDWYDREHTIIKVTIACDSTWDEYHEVIDWIVTEAKTVNHRVDLIFHDEVGMPDGNPLPHLREGSKKLIRMSNMGNTYVAGSQGKTGSFTQLIMSSLAKVFTHPALPIAITNQQLLFLPTLEAALERIQQDHKQSGEIL